MLFLFFGFVFVAKCEIGLPYYACDGITNCISLNFTSFNVNDASKYTIKGGNWQRTTTIETKTGKNFILDTLKQTSSPTITSVCDQEGYMLFFNEALAFPRPKMLRTKFKLLASVSAAGFVFNHNSPTDYLQETAFRGPCLSQSYSMGGSSKVDNAIINKPNWFTSGAGPIEIDRWYELTVILNDDLVQVQLRDLTSTLLVKHSWSDFIVGLLKDRGYNNVGLFCLGQCEFDDVVVTERKYMPVLSGPLYCQQCVGAIWGPGSADWCRCCAYKCGNATAQYGTTSSSCPGFCTAANRCQSEPDTDRNAAVYTYCSAIGGGAAALGTTTPGITSPTPSRTTQTTTRSPTPAAFTTRSTMPQPSPTTTRAPPGVPTPLPTPSGTISQVVYTTKPVPTPPTTAPQPTPTNGLTTTTITAAMQIDGSSSSSTSKSAIVDGGTTISQSGDSTSTCLPSTLGCSCVDNLCLNRLSCINSVCENLISGGASAVVFVARGSLLLLTAVLFFFLLL